MCLLRRACKKPYSLGQLSCNNAIAQGDLTLSADACEDDDTDR